MAAMSTALTVFSDKENSRTYTLSDHTAVKPHIVIQTRKLGSGTDGVAESNIQVTYATTDANGLVITPKDSMSVKVRTALQGSSADVTAMLAVFRDIIAGDEFGNAVTTQEYLV
jgi:hypothetical protein